MLFADLLFALSAGILLTLIFTVFSRKRAQTRDSAFVVFMLIFLSTWAAGAWVTTGPVIFNVYLLPIFLTGSLLLLLFMGFAPDYAYTDQELHRREDMRRKVGRVEALAAINIFFWIIFFMLSVTIALAYIT